MKKYCRGSYSIVGVLAVVITLIATFGAHNRAFAESVYSVAAPVISQHLHSPDSNGDTGYYNCTIAATAMALQALQKQGTFSLTSHDLSYEKVRITTRSYYPNIAKGVTFPEQAPLISLLTNHKIQGTYVRAGQSTWESMLTTQLSLGYPVVVHISDWRYLPGHQNHGKAAHAVTVIGITDSNILYIDPWDSRVVVIPKADFAAAWSTGYYSWGGLYFQKIEKATSFSEVLQRVRLRAII